MLTQLTRTYHKEMNLGQINMSMLRAVMTMAMQDHPFYEQYCRMRREEYEVFRKPAALYELISWDIKLWYFNVTTRRSCADFVKQFGHLPPSVYPVL